MDTRKVLRQDEVIELVRKYKRAISPRLNNNLKVFLFGSYSKGHATPNSDIDVAVIVPQVDEDWWTLTTDLALESWGISSLIEPVLIEENKPSPLYRDILRTGIAV